MSIAHRAVRGTAIILVSSYGNLALGFITTIALTRILSPEIFGLFALAAVLYSALDLRNKLGLDYAFIHSRQPVESVAATHWLLQLLLASITLAVSGIVAVVLLVLGYSRFVSVVLVSLCALGAIEAAGSTARVILEKDLRFLRSTAVISGALAVSNLAAVLLAWLGAGIWSLVAQVGLNTLIGAVGFWLISGARPSIAFMVPVARWLLRYGLVLTLGSIATIVVLQGDNYMVGTLVGAVTLGYYERAYKVAQWPTGLVTHIVSRVALPTYAKLQDENQRLGKAFGLTLWVIVSVATPLALALFVSAPDFILLIFGEAWAPSAVLLRFLVGYSVLRPLLDDTGALLVATGHPKKVTQLAVAQAVALIVFALPLTVVYGATGTAIGVGLTFLSGVGLAYYFVSRVVRIDWQATFLSPLISVVVALGSYWLLAQFMDLNALPLLLRVIFKGGFVAGMFMLTLIVFQRDTIDRLRYIWRLLRGR